MDRSKKGNSLAGGNRNRKKRSGSFYRLVFLFLAAIIITTGFLFYHGSAFSFRSEAERQLNAIVELKVNELANWRRGLEHDALLFFQNGVFADLVKRYFAEPPDADAQRQIRTWLGHFQAARQY